MKTAGHHRFQKNVPLLATSLWLSVQRAFTPRELLVAITFAAILAAMSFPALGGPLACGHAKGSSISKTTLAATFLDANGVDALPTDAVAPRRDSCQCRIMDVHSDLMARLTIARHGSRMPGKTPRALAGTVVLPVVINIAMNRSHAELVKFENLWPLYWCNGISPPEHESCDLLIA